MSYHEIPKITIIPPASKDRTLTAEEFWIQLHPYSEDTYSEVVIRGLDGDYGLAAVHRDGDRMIFDLGRKLED